MKKHFIWLLVICYGLSYAAFAAQKEDQTISVTGTGMVQAEPDTATVRLGVEVSRKTAQEAQSGNAEIMQKVMGAVEKAGLTKENIQTSGYNIYPEMKYETNQPPRIVGYRCSNQVNITIEDLKRISKVIDEGIAAGANQVQSIQFSRKDDLEYKKRALDQAVKEAAAKAQAIAAAAGLKIKGIVNIIESGASAPPSQPMEFLSMKSAGAETPVSPGLLEIRGSVTVIYKIE